MVKWCEKNPSALDLEFFRVKRTRPDMLYSRSSDVSFVSLDSLA